MTERRYRIDCVEHAMAMTLHTRREWLDQIDAHDALDHKRIFFAWSEPTEGEAA